MASRIIAEQSAKQVSSVTGSDGEVRQVVAIEMKLVTDNLSKNAALYKDLVAEFSNRYQVEQPLMLVSDSLRQPLSALLKDLSAGNPQIVFAASVASILPIARVMLAVLVQQGSKRKAA